MKRYGKLIVIGMIIVVSFALFILDYGKISKAFPNFVIKDISGDRAELDDIKINGNGSYGMYYGGERFLVDTTGTRYLRDLSFSVLDGYYYSSPEILKLEADHRQFMRGKNRWDTLFYEDDAVLAYVNTPRTLTGLGNEFSVAVLDKQTNETRDFTLPIPNRKDYWDVSLDQVIVADHTLFVITRNDSKSNLMSDTYVGENIHLYSIDIAKEEMIAEKEFTGLMQENYDEDSYAEVNVLYSIDSSLDEIIITETKTTYEEIGTEELDNDMTETTHEAIIETTKVLAYNLETKTEEALVFEKDKGTLIAFEGDVGYFAELIGNDVHFKQVDLVNGRVLTENTHDFKGLIDSIYALQNAQIVNGKMYMVETNYDEQGNRNDTTLYVVDMATFDILYEGKIVAEQMDDKYSAWFDYDFNGFEFN